MKNGKIEKLINDVLRDFTAFVPFGWVLTCYELGTGWIGERPVEGIWTLVCATAISAFLCYVGQIAAYGKVIDSINGETFTIWERIRNLLILLAVLLWITIMISHAYPPDDVI